jgi:predicted transcriptional regulator
VTRNDNSIPEEAYLEHFGIKRRSGRYPWGSGKDPEQRSREFKGFVEDLKSPPHSMTDTEIAKHIEAIVKQSDPHASFSTTDLRAATAISTEELYAANQAVAQRLAKSGMSTSAIARQMLGDSKKESTVRGWLKAGNQIKENSLRATAEKLKQQVEEKEFLDVGKGNHLYMGVSETKFKTAIAMLRDEGYNVHPVKVPQLGTRSDQMTNTLVLTKEGVPWSEARKAVVDGRLKVITAQSDDGGLTFRTPKDMPVSVNSKRIEVRYGDKGGSEMDGVIELRRGVEDLDLGANRYAQVRIAVDGTHYLKGMAMYADDLPDGVDIRFNTNKPSDTSGGKIAVMKPMKVDKQTNAVDPNNPFGASTRPRVYIDKKGKEQTSPLNVVNEEGNWDAWSKNLSSQMLSKQPLSLASTQLGKARAAKEQDLATIMALTNPVVKKKLLMEYADSADAAAVHLKAASMDRQATKVILPMNSMRPHEVYAPGYDNGERVVLVRHPHGGPFEIPELRVNNNNPVARRILGTDPRDAIGIHHSVAEQLSGADFDGDTVLLIPNPAGRIKTRPPLEGLKNFNAKEIYAIPEGDTTTPRMTKKLTQSEMGKISNLITDMTIHKATDDELARAVRHSMVVIDAEKHGLNYKASEEANGIAALKAKYQGKANAGASTLISKASSDDRIPQVKLRQAKDGGPIDEKTGQLVWEPTGATRLRPSTRKSDPPGTMIEEPKTTKGTKMEFATVDSHGVLRDSKGKPMSSGTPMEEVYASHAVAMKNLANAARREAVNLEMPRVSKAAQALYAKEVSSLDAKLKEAQRNAPLERRAQVIGNALAKQRIDANPQFDKDDIKKVKYQSLEEARNITGANKVKIGSEQNPLTDREWEAIQAGAVAHSKLSEMLMHADINRVRELATPKPRGSITPGQMARARALRQMGRPLSDIARELGIPRSTLNDNLDG